MRAKVVLSASVLALLILAPVIYFHFAPASPPADQAASAPAQAAPAAPVAAAPVAAHHRTIVAPKEVEAAPAPDSSDPSDDPIADRQAQLTQLGMSDDPNDLKTILSELNNKNAGIRSAALAATLQFGSKDAIPALQNELSWTEDPEEKVEIKKAIEYLQLPSFQEFTANLAAGAAPPAGDQPAPAN